MPDSAFVNCVALYAQTISDNSPRLRRAYIDFICRSSGAIGVPWRLKDGSMPGCDRPDTCRFVHPSDRHWAQAIDNGMPRVYMLHRDQKDRHVATPSRPARRLHDESRTVREDRRRSQSPRRDHDPVNPSRRSRSREPRDDSAARQSPEHHRRHSPASTSNLRHDPDDRRQRRAHTPSSPNRHRSTRSRESRASVSAHREDTNPDYYRRHTSARTLSLHDRDQTTSSVTKNEEPSPPIPNRPDPPQHSVRADPLQPLVNVDLPKPPANADAPQPPANADAPQPPANADAPQPPANIDVPQPPASVEASQSLVNVDSSQVHAKPETTDETMRKVWAERIRLIAGAIRARADVLLLQGEIGKLAAMSRGDARFTGVIQTRRDAETAKEGEYEAVIEKLATMHIWPELASKDVASAEVGQTALAEQVRCLREQVEQLLSAVSIANAQRKLDKGQSASDEHASISTPVEHPDHETDDGPSIMQDVEQRLAALEVMLDDLTNDLAEHKNEYMDEISSLREDHIAQQDREEKLHEEIRDLRQANAQLNSELERITAFAQSGMASMTGELNAMRSAVREHLETPPPPPPVSEETLMDLVRPKVKTLVRLQIQPMIEELRQAVQETVNAEHERVLHDLGGSVAKTMQTLDVALKYLETLRTDAALNEPISRRPIDALLRRVEAPVTSDVAGGLGVAPVHAGQREDLPQTDGKTTPSAQ